MVGMGFTCFSCRKVYSNKMMIQIKNNFVSFDTWKDIYEKARKKEISCEHFGYGIKVDSSVLNIDIDLPLKPYFFFLVSNRRRREFPIHVDGIPEKQNAASINWAISGCDEKSPTDFFHCCTTAKWKDLDNSFFLENTHEAVKTHSVIMYDNNAYLFRSDLLHKGYYNTDDNQLRIIVKWELEYDNWQIACTEFFNRNYI